jgi:methionyl-tRNA formyltransferase
MAPKITSDDARIRWEDPGFADDRRVRACTPAPGAWSRFRQERLRVGPVEPSDAGLLLTPGETRLAGGKVLVGTGTTPVTLGQVQPAGRKWMSADAWVRGARPGLDERLT